MGDRAGSQRCRAVRRPCWRISDRSLKRCVVRREWLLNFCKLSTFSIDGHKKRVKLLLRMEFYVDSCIYLNLWQKEEKWWKFALNFFEAAERRGDVIYYSGFVLKELNFVLTPKEFNIKKRLFEEVIF